MEDPAGLCPTRPAHLKSRVFTRIVSMCRRCGDISNGLIQTIKLARLSQAIADAGYDIEKAAI
jgi:hypothetical protein